MSLTVPFLVSCTGHRDMENLPKLKQTVGSIFRGLLDRMPHTPLRILTGLAEGADQLCADAALALEPKERIRVTAILAFPPDVFLKTIKDPKAQKRFEELIADSRLPSSRIDFFIAPALDDRSIPASTDPVGWENERQDNDKRRHRYREVAACLVLYGQAMVAVWDGQPKEKSGGTGEVVDAWFRGDSDDIYPGALINLEPFERRPLYHVWTRRVSQPYAPLGGDAASVRELFLPHDSPTMTVGQSFGSDLGNAWRLWRKNRVLHFLVGITETMTAVANVVRDFFAARRMVPIGERHIRALFAANQANLDHLNHDLAPLDFDATLEQGARDLEGLPVQSLPPRLQKMLVVRRAVADAAAHGSNRLGWVVVIVFWLIGAGAFLLHLYGHHIHLEDGALTWSPWLLLGGSLAIAAAWAIGLRAHFVHLEARYLDRRSLAEALRVQLYWSAAGLSDSVPASYLQRQRSELAWIRAAVRALAIPYDAGARDFHGLASSQQIERLRVVVQKWALGQASYFDGELSRLRARLFFFQRLGLFLALAGWALGLFLFLGWPSWLGDAGHPTPATLTCLAVLLLGGGLLVAYTENRQLREAAFSYDHMRHLFRNGHDRLQQHLRTLTLDSAPLPPDELNRIQRLLRELGHEALEENADWITLHRARPFEPPVH